MILACLLIKVHNEKQISLIYDLIFPKCWLPHALIFIITFVTKVQLYSNSFVNTLLELKLWNLGHNMEFTVLLRKRILALLVWLRFLFLFSNYETVLNFSKFIFKSRNFKWIFHNIYFEIMKLRQNLQLQVTVLWISKIYNY